LLILHDETLTSSWCRFEIEIARQCGIPIICVCDTDKQTVRSIVDFYMEDHPYLFDEQVGGVILPFSCIFLIVSRFSAR
jgi:hypothetical protein